MVGVDAEIARPVCDVFERAGHVASFKAGQWKFSLWSMCICNHGLVGAKNVNRMDYIQDITPYVPPSPAPSLTSGKTGTSAVLPVDKSMKGRTRTAPSMWTSSRSCVRTVPDSARHRCQAAVHPQARMLLGAPCFKLGSRSDLMSTRTLRPSVTHAAPNHLALVPKPDATESRLKRLATAGASAKARGAKLKAAESKATVQAAAAGPTVVAGDLGTQLPSESPLERPKLKYERRWATWKDEAVGVVAVIWADMRIEMEDLRLAPLMEEMKQVLCEELGEEAVVSIVDEHFLQLHRLFVCLMASAEDCQRVWDSWRPRTLLRGAAKVTWRDTIDAGSSRLVPRLNTCWNPMRLEMDGMSLEIPSKWATKEATKTAKCMPGSHWHEFARIFGEVLEVDLVASHSEIAQLVVRFADSSGAYAAYKKLSGRCLYNSRKDLSLIRVVYGSYANLLGRALRGTPTPWSCQARDLTGPGPLGPGGRGVTGPVFELYPLRPGERAKPGEILRLVPWGPSTISVGKNRKSDLSVTDYMAGVSNSHAELQLMQSRAAGIRLFISDSSKNGTWVNEHRLPKGALRELKDGDQLRLADVPRFTVRKFESLQQCQRAPIPADGPEFKVPPCPYFIKKVKSTGDQSNQQTSHVSNSLKAALTNAQWSEVPRVPEDDGTELWAEIPRLPDEEEPSSDDAEPEEPPVSMRKRPRRWIGQDSEALGIICGLVTSCAQHVLTPRARYACLDMLQLMVPLSSQETLLEQIIPYSHVLMTDPVARVKARSVDVLCSALAQVQELPSSHAPLFTEYIFPQLMSMMSGMNNEPVVLLSVARNLGTLATHAQRCGQQLAASTENQDVDTGVLFDVGTLEEALNKIVKALLEFLPAHSTEKINQEDQLISLSVSREVKIALLRNMCVLADCFGRESTHSFLLPYLISFMNDPAWEVRAAFCTEAALLPRRVGQVSTEGIIWPCYEQALLDQEERVVEAALMALTKLVAQQVLRRQNLVTVANKVAPLLVHPSEPIRNHASQEGRTDIE
eukprot:s414_g24.t1